MFQIPTEMMTKSTLAKIRNIVKDYYIYVILCVLLTGMFFGFEYLPKHSKEYYTVKKEVKKVIKANNFWLKKLKKKAIGSEEHNNYLTANREKKIAVDKYEALIKYEKVKRFKTIRIFFKEFGSYFGFFLYALFNLFQSFTKRKNNAIKLFHTYLLGICIFFMYWAVQPFEDLSKFSYYFVSIFSTLIMLTSVFLIVKTRKTKIQKLEAQKKEIAKFAYLNIPEDKNDEMIDVLDKNL